MKMYKRCLRTILLVAVFTNNLNAQSGDQILDGIGETAMITRYVFDGNTKDWSRNNLHANFQGQNPQYVTDSRFGKVLSLSGNASDYLKIPNEILADIESLSISSWVNLRSKTPGQFLFDFGQNSDIHFFAAPVGTLSKQGLQAGVTVKNNNKNIASSASLPLNKWVLLTIVIDVPSKSITTYVDSKQVANVKNLSFEPTDVFGKKSKENNQLLIGKSIKENATTLNALIKDFRIYRIALNKTQIAGIYKNAQLGVNTGSVNTTATVVDDLQHFSPTKAQLYNNYLVQVANVKAETSVGELPRLPSFVEGKYKGGIKGPKVRVIWPAPTDNSSVQTTKTYVITGRVAGTNFRPQATITVKEASNITAPAASLESFHLSQVSLNTDEQGRNTKFIENRDKFINTLAATDPNSFLYMFRHAFKQPQPAGAKPLGVWDSEDTKVRGHATGHYLTAIAQAYASTEYDKNLQANFLQKMDYMVNSLHELSQLSGKPQNGVGPYNRDASAVPVGPGKTEYDSELSDAGIRHDYWNWGVGFISAYPPDQFIMLEKGAKYGGKKNQIWAPYYTLHKILAGLTDIYEVSGNKKALDIATGMGDWVYTRLSKLPTDTLIKMWNTYIAGEFGGMNESMARLYRLTGKDTYLKTAQLFDNIRVFFGDNTHVHGLAKNVDIFRGLHANQHIPQIVGSIETYKVSNNPEYYKIADNFWYKAVNDYMYSIGGVAGARNPANAECFVSQPTSLYENGFSNDGQNETCATYNMLKLTDELFMFDQRPELMDYYERALYNHILASVDEHTPANTYHVPLRPGSIKQFGNPDMSGFTCCNGTAIESSTKLQNSIYFKSKDNQSLYVNLFVPSTLNWLERNVKITQVTSFPKNDETKLIVNGEGEFTVQIRLPAWATKGHSIKINGKDQKIIAQPESYVKLNRSWKDGDVIEIKMPFQFHLDPVMDQPNIASLFYGPILLAAQEPEARKEWRKVTLYANDLGKTIKGDPQQLQFTIDGIVYKPFYDSYGRHSVYLDVTLK
jgi:DUF1680 family protein